MRPKYKMTGCARFVIFFIILVPAVYFAATFIRGEDGMQKLKDTYHNIIGRNEPKDAEKGSDTYSLEELQKELDAAKQEIRELKNTIKEQEREIEELRKE